MVPMVTQIDFAKINFSDVWHRAMPNVTPMWDACAPENNISTTGSTHEGSMWTYHETKWTGRLGWWIQDVFIIPLKVEHPLSIHFKISPYDGACSHTKSTN